MGVDRHLGRQSPTYVIEGHLDKFINLINNHGVLARVMRSRNCPCVTNMGSPDLYCPICKGDGLLYDFQRRLLNVDELCYVHWDTENNVNNKILPFRVPLIEPLRVERMLPPEQGGICKYNIVSWDSNEIIIEPPSASERYPLYYENVRASYYFDRFDEIIGDVVDVNPATKTLAMTQTRYDGTYRHGNVFNVHGDIAEVIRVYDTERNHEYKNYHFRKHYIYLDKNEPTPTPGKVICDYLYTKPCLVLPSDSDVRYEKGERYTTKLASGQCRIALEPWYEVGEGDMITLLTPTYYKSEVVVHNANIAYDKLFEFDIRVIDERIFDEDGNTFLLNTDYVLANMRDLHWIGRQPAAGRKYSVRYGYHPTYRVFIDDAMPNTLESKQYPTVVTARIWSKTLAKDFEQIKAGDDASYL